MKTKSSPPPDLPPRREGLSSSNYYHYTCITIGFNFSGRKADNSFNFLSSQEKSINPLNYKAKMNKTIKTILQIIGYVIAAILGGAGASCLL